MGGDDCEIRCRVRAGRAATSARVMGQSVSGLFARRCSLAGFLLANASPRLFNRYPRAASGTSTC